MSKKLTEPFHSYWYTQKPLPKNITTRTLTDFGENESYTLLKEAIKKRAMEYTNQ